MWDKAWKSMQRAEAKGRKIGLFNDVLQLDVSFPTKEGPSDKGIKINKRRVNRVIEKMIRGFYYHHFRKRLDGVTFQIDLRSSINPGTNRKAIEGLLIKVLNSPTWMQKFGPETWVACGLAVEDTRAGIWVIRFFGGHIVFVLTAPSGFWDKPR